MCKANHTREISLPNMILPHALAAHAVNTVSRFNNGSSGSYMPVIMCIKKSTCASSLAADLLPQVERSFSPRENKWIIRQTDKYMSKATRRLQFGLAKDVGSVNCLIHRTAVNVLPHQSKATRQESHCLNFLKKRLVPLYAVMQQWVVYHMKSDCKGAPTSLLRDTLSQWRNPPHRGRAFLR